MDKKLYSIFLTLILVLSITGCKPKYEAPGSSINPIEETLSKDAPYSLNFIELHNEVIENLLDDYEAGFIKDIDIDGTNDPKIIKISMDVLADSNGTFNDDVLNSCLSYIVKLIGDEANIQDGRFTVPNKDSFSSVFEQYDLDVEVRCDGKTIVSQYTDAGESLPYIMID